MAGTTVAVVTKQNDDLTKARQLAQAGFLTQCELQERQVLSDQHKRTLDELCTSLTRSGVNFALIPYEKLTSLDTYGTVVTVGGDGTLLATSHHISYESVRVIGVRSNDASIGYLCPVGPAEIHKVAQALTSEKSVDWFSATRIEAHVEKMGDGEIIRMVSPPVLNDFLFTNIHPAATTRYVLALGDFREAQKSSGIWISTAIGSSAGILAAGGTQVDADRKDCQYFVREPLDLVAKIPYQSKKGFFRCGTNSLSIENRCDHAILAHDGQHGSTHLEWGDRVTFRYAAPITLARSL